MTDPVFPIGPACEPDDLDLLERGTFTRGEMRLATDHEGTPDQLLRRYTDTLIHAQTTHDAWDWIAAGSAFWRYARAATGTEAQVPPFNDPFKPDVATDYDGMIKRGVSSPGELRLARQRDRAATSPVPSPEAGNRFRRALRGLALRARGERQ